MKIHLVKKAETLGGIARQHGLSADALAGANFGRSISVISPGMSLVIPGEKAESTESMELCSFPALPLPESVLSQTLPYSSYLAPCSFGIDSGGELITPRLPDMSGAAPRGCAALLYLTNADAEGNSSPYLAHRLFTEEDFSSRFTDNLIQKLKSGDFYGLHLSFNYLFPFDRDNYSRFVHTLAQKLHNAGFMLSLELVPQDSAVSSGQDYAALGKAADRLCLICCRWSYAFSPPGPPAPIPKIRDALELTLRSIPAHKLWLGIACAGLDWTLPWRHGDSARQLSSSAAMEIAGALGAEICYEPQSHSPGFTYIDAAAHRHILYFEDSRSLYEKLKLCREYSLAGLGLYSCEKAFPPLFSLLDGFCQVEKPL